MTQDPASGNTEWGIWQSWLDAWNRHDLEIILEHYAEHVEFVSKAVIELGINRTGSVAGKPALRQVFAAGLQFDRELVFSPLHAFAGVREHALHYIGFRRRHVIEIHEVDAQGKIITARAYHGIAP